MGVHKKMQFLGGGGWSKWTNILMGLPKKGGLDSLQILEGSWHKKGGIFEGGWYPNAYYDY